MPYGKTRLYLISHRVGEAVFHFVLPIPAKVIAALKGYVYFGRCTVADNYVVSG